MESLIDQIPKDNTPLLFTITLFFAAVSGINFSVKLRVTLIYTYCLIVNQLEAIDTHAILIGSTLVLFLTLEVFNPDQKHVTLLNARYKLIDFIYKVTVEMYGLFYYTLIICPSFMPDHILDLPFVNTIVLFLTLGLAIATSRGTFSSKPISELIATLESLGDSPSSLTFTDSDKRKLEMLLYIEDKTYLSRKEHQHRLLLIDYLPTIISELKHLAEMLLQWIKKAGISFHEIQDTAIRYIRGFGTIEMQLLRNIGLDTGSFRHTIKRKLYELTYAQIFFNSYLNRFSKESYARQNFKYWLLNSYLQIVPVKIGKTIVYPEQGKSTFQCLFSKDFSQLTMEEFFVWCIGLPHYENGVGPNAVEIHSQAVYHFELDRDLIDSAIETARIRVP